MLCHENNIDSYSTWSSRDFVLACLSSICFNVDANIAWTWPWFNPLAGSSNQLQDLKIKIKLDWENTFYFFFSASSICSNSLFSPGCSILPLARLADLTYNMSCNSQVIIMWYRLPLGLYGKVCQQILPFHVLNMSSIFLKETKVH